MDPIGLVGTLLAIIQIGGKVTSVCLEYHNRIKDAPEDISRLLVEVRSIRGIVERVADIATTNSDVATLPSLEQLVAPDGALTFCLADLVALNQLLEKGKAGVGNWRGLLWPLKSKDLAGLVQRLGHAKATLQLALSADTGMNVIELLKKAKELSIKTNKLGMEEGEAHLLCSFQDRPLIFVLRS